MCDTNNKQDNLSPTLRFKSDCFFLEDSYFLLELLIFWTTQGNPQKHNENIESPQTE